MSDKMSAFTDLLERDIELWNIFNKWLNIQPRIMRALGTPCDDQFSSDLLMTAKSNITEANQLRRFEDICKEVGIIIG